MKLYYAPESCAVAIWIALEWAGAAYEVENVELGSEEYMKINPSGAVPALDTGDGKIKTQAGPLLSYIAEKYPEADLGPDEGTEERFRFEEISEFLTADYHPAFWPLFVPEEFTVSTDEDDLENIQKRHTSPSMRLQACWTICSRERSIFIRTRKPCWMPMSIS